MAREDISKRSRGRPPKLAATPTRSGSQSYYCQTGLYIGSDGVPRPPKFQLGQDAKVAAKLKKTIRDTWKALKLTGHKTWPADTLRDLAERGVISLATAETASNGEIIKTIKTVIKSPELKQAELDKFRDSNGELPADNVPGFMAHLFTQELTEPESVEWLRKWTKSLIVDDPEKALIIYEKLYKLKREAEGKTASHGVTVNIGSNLIPQDASEGRIPFSPIVLKPAPAQEADNG